MKSTDLVQDTISVTDEIDFDTEFTQAKINLCSAYVEKSLEINTKLQELAQSISAVANEFTIEELDIWNYLHDTEKNESN